MPCSRKRKAPATFTQGKQKTDYVPTHKDMPSDCLDFDVIFTLSPNINSSASMTYSDVYPVGSPIPDKKFINGVAFAVKFPNVEEACPRTIRDFDTPIKVPRLYDVAVVKASVPRTGRRTIMAGKSGDYLAQNKMETGGSGQANVMKELGYVIATGNQKFFSDVEENIGTDYVMVVAQKDVYPVFVQKLREYCGYVTRSGTLESTLHRWAWYATCQDVQPIFSRYYKWVVDGTQSVGQQVLPDGNMGYTSLDQVEIGHYEEDEFNKKFDNYEMSPNDVYTDGAVIGLIGNNTLMMKEEKLFADAYFHLILYYRLEEVKAGVIYLQNVREFQDLTHYGRQRHTFTDQGEDITNMSVTERLTKKGCGS